MRVIAIDPGDVHTGVATYDHGVWTWEGGFWTAAQGLDAQLATGAFEVVVCEEFRLYPWLAMQQGYSDFRTSQLIGAIRWIAHQHEVPVVFQQATIKKPTFAIMGRRGVEARGKNQHEKDADAHLYHFHNQGDN